MTRDEMLEALHNIRVGAKPVVVTMDMGLQYEYVTSKGFGGNFGNMGAWPVYQICDVSNELLVNIKRKIQDKTVCIGDMENSGLLSFYQCLFENDELERNAHEVASFFHDLVAMAMPRDNIIYALCDGSQWTPEASFYATYEEMEEAFVDQYAFYVDPWETLSDNELMKWIERIKKELDSIPFTTIGKG